MDHETIGKAAGIVWQRLWDSQDRGVTVSTLKRTDGLRSEEVMAAIGWLAREGKLVFEENGSKLVVRLVQTECSV